VTDHENRGLYLERTGDSMDWGAVGQMIGTLGFPIVACIALFYFMMQQLSEHKEEINALKGALEANTMALVELKGLIEHERDKD
jgi:hypothetical protein